VEAARSSKSYVTSSPPLVSLPHGASSSSWPDGASGCTSPSPLPHTPPPHPPRRRPRRPQASTLTWPGQDPEQLAELAAVELQANEIRSVSVHCSRICFVLHRDEIRSGSPRWSGRPALETTAPGTHRSPIRNHRARNSSLSYPRYVGFSHSDVDALTPATARGGGASARQMGVRRLVRCRVEAPYLAPPMLLRA
jgi:hypothetical protein